MIDIKKVSKRKQEPADNYAQFESRLDSAIKSLSARNSSITVGQEIINQLIIDNRVSMSRWSKELRSVTAIISHYDGGDEGYRTLADLLDTATRMEALFRQRLERLREKQKAVDANQTAIMASISELEASKHRLGFSRMLHDDREKLRQTALELGGLDNSVATSIGDGGLPVDLKNAREAVAMAEALLEVKGV